MLKERVKLEKEKETLLIPLYSKAEESKKEKPILSDPKAVDIIENGIDYDYSKLRIPYKTKLSLSMRAKQLDIYTQAFLKKYPDGTVIHLACGLDSRFCRVDNGNVNWYDLDFPEVIDLRRKFYSESDRYHLIPSSVADLEWMDQIQVNVSGKYFFVAEGLLMYLTPADVKTLILELSRRFPGSQLACDVFSTFTVKQISKHPSIRKTQADIFWGIDNAKEIEQWDQDIKIFEEWFFSHSPELEKLSFGYRLGFKLAALLPIANKAHRILLIQL